MPTPNKGEKKSDFISRCISDLVKNEGYEKEQASAICYSKWENKGKKKSMNLDIYQDRVWAIHPSKLDEINAFILNRFNSGAILTEEEIEAVVGNSGNKAPDNVIVENGIAKIPVNGTISKKMNLMSRMSGGTSTELLKRDIKASFDDENIKGVLLSIDSPGGTVEGVKELSDFIFDNKNKPVVAYTDGMMASAAYWIGSAADRLIATETSMVGSIGVASVHYDMSEQDKMMGIKRTNIYAGKYKRIAADNEPLSKDGKEYIQEHVDTYYDLFLESVARNRGVDKEQALAMADGKVFIGKKALVTGLIDSLGDEETAMTWAITQGKEEKPGANTEVLHLGTFEVEGGNEDMDLKELKEKHMDLVTQIEKDAMAKKEEENRKATEDLLLRVKAIEAENKNLRKKVEVMEEKEIQSKVQSIWESKLSKSKIPSRRHESIKKQISVDSFDTEGVIDWKVFETAVDTEIADWEKDFQSATPVIGFGASSKEVKDDDFNLDDDERNLTADEQALVERSLKLVSNVVEGGKK